MFSFLAHLVLSRSARGLRQRFIHEYACTCECPAVIGTLRYSGLVFMPKSRFSAKLQTPLSIITQLIPKRPGHMLHTPSAFEFMTLRRLTCNFQKQNHRAKPSQTRKLSIWFACINVCTVHQPTIIMHAKKQKFKYYFVYNYIYII